MNRGTSSLSGVRWLAYGLLVVAATASLACEGDLQILRMIFNTDSLGGEVPGRRADLRVRFVNQTAFRPVFTFGTYDPLNTRPSNELFFPPKFDQFVIDTTDGGISLDAFSESDVFTFSAESLGDPGGCGRAISLGGEQFIQLLEENETLLDAAQAEALRPLCKEATNEPEAGIAFFAENSQKGDPYV